MTIKGFLGVLQQDLEGGEQETVQDDIAEIGGAADKMTQLLDELLELSRIGRIADPSADVPLGDVITEALEATAGAIAARGVEVKVLDDFPVVLGDHLRLRQVIQNLIDNAVKFSDAINPQVEIGMRGEGKQAVCFIHNNGLGIEPSYHDKVFGLFEQLDASSEGTGIGLAIVKRIIEVHNGRIWVESKGAKTGCTFCFVLPWNTK